MIPARFFGLDDWFDSFHGASRNDSACTPRAAVAEKDGGYILEVDLPGAKKRISRFISRMIRRKSRLCAKRQPPRFSTSVLSKLPRNSMPKQRK